MTMTVSTVPPTLGTFTTLLTPDGYNPKTDKGRARGYSTAVLYLAPADASGVMNVCQYASDGCKATCLYSAGRGGFDPEVPAARIARTRWFLLNRFAFNERLVREVISQRETARRRGRTFVFRPNGTSDLPWHRLLLNDGRTLLETFPDIQMYDYTKDARKARAYGRGELPANYHVTFSRSEVNENECLEVLASGGNVAVVFSTRKCTRFCVYDVETRQCRKVSHRLPATWHGYRVVDGDLDDLRFLDDRNVVVGLRAKGDAKHDASGFVVAYDDPATWPDVRPALAMLNAAAGCKVAA